MGPLTDILNRFKDRPAEELKAYLEGYNQAYVDMEIGKRKRQKETLEILRKHQSFPRISAQPSPPHDSRGLNTSSNEEFSKGEDIDEG